MKIWRAYLVLLFFIFLGSILTLRLFTLQIRDHGLYKALAQGQQNATLFTKGQRGIILAKDKQGNLIPLATNQKLPFAFASPALVENPEETASLIADILSLAKEEILPLLQKKDSFFELLKKRISKEEVEAISAQNLQGISIGMENVRLYPNNALAAHVLGFVNQDGRGQYGIESFYDDSLQGKEAFQESKLNPASYFLSVFAKDAPQGTNVVLTLNIQIQAFAESLLQTNQEVLGFEEGTVIVMDPRTGKILALANAPSFNPNEYHQVADFEVFQNPATQGLFEPGSVLKGITMASALDARALTPDTTYEDKGVVQIGGYKVYNYDNRVWGKRTMEEVLEFSINTGAVFAAQQLGNERFLEYVQKFGLLEKTGIDLPGEIYSQNKELQQRYEITFATASFGQGIEMTPLQLVRAYAAIANGGKLVQPFLKEGTEPSLGEQVISPEAAWATTNMLVSVTEKGYGKGARIPGYTIAGKTGTAQISWSALGEKKSGYSDKTVQSFIGYAPAYNPQFLILVKLQNPQTKTAEYSAVPIFRDLAKYIIDYLEIPPDYEVE